MEEWKEYKLGDLYEVHNGLSKGGNFFGSGYPFLSFSTVFKNFFLPQSLDSLVLTTEKERSNFDIKRGDVFITRTSETADELGMSSVALKDYPDATYNGFTKRLRPINGEIIVSPEYIGYYLRSPKFRGLFYGLSSSMSTRASLANGDLLNMKVYLPSLKVQKRISSILKSLDDKIQNNRKINENLEQQAQALFKSWFVDFEPFRDQPFVESELGMIPEGWRVGNFGSLFDIKYGKDHKKLDDGIYPVYGSGGLMRKANKYLYQGESVLIPRKGSLNNVMYVNESFWTVDTMFYTVPKIDDIVIFAFMQLRNKDLSSMNVGSAVPSMTTEVLNNIKFVLPTDKIMFDFNSLATNLYRVIKHNESESHRLSQLRDTLLPKLMSGEIKL